jgi:NhaA family Na+:H+ antiporter
VSEVSNEQLSRPEIPLVDDVFRPAYSFFQKFFKREASSSILLLAATIMTLIWANSILAHTYQELWHTEVSFGFGKYRLIKSLHHWINDGLMTFFFFTVGLEIKRELLVGALASRKRALLPIVAAIGGMLVPGIIYFAFNHGGETAAGWGIPMATDIAFALGAIAIFGRRLPIGLRVFLTAFAIADDLGAVFVITLFYTKEIVWHYLLICIVLALGLAVANLLWIRWTVLYGLLGLGIWFSVLGSGIHPTVAGIIVAMLIPARAKYDTDQFVKKVDATMAAFKCGEQSCGYTILLNRDHLNAVHALGMACHDVETPLQQLEHGLHPWVVYGVLPLFALANAGLTLKGMNLTAVATHPLTVGITLGLFLGKPLGVSLFSYLAVKTGLASLPEGVRWSHIAGAGMLGGIGFTMSLFISSLSFSSPVFLDYSKLGILMGSLLSAVAGVSFLGIICVLDGNRHV